MSLRDIPAESSTGARLCPDCGDELTGLAPAHPECDPLALAEIEHALSSVSLLTSVGMGATV